jgi:hypothetical protein
MSLVFGLKKDKCFIKNLRKRLQELDNTSFDVGYFPQQGTHQPSGMSYSNLFAIHSFGSKSAGIPARPVLDLNFQLWNPVSSNKLIKKQLKSYFSNIKSTNAPIKFSTILDTIAGSYVQSTRAIFGDSTKLVSNSSFTVSQKGTQSPLVETGDLRDHLSYTTTFRGNTIVTP